MGKRIADPSIASTTFTTAVSNNGKLAVDWLDLVTNNIEAKNIDIKLLGNTRVQGSADGSTGWTDTVLSSHPYIRISTDGGTQWIVFKVSACNGTETLHPPMTLNPASAAYATIDEENQVLTINAPITSGTNTGDETAATIKAKLGITTLSGSNTGDQNATQVPILDVDNYFVGTDVEAALKALYERFGLIKNCYSITLPTSTTVAGRVAGAVEGTDYPTGWVLSAGVSPVDLYISHGLNKRFSSVSIFAITGTEEQQLFNTAAYNGFKTPSVNEAIIQSLATINKPIKIYLMTE